MKLGIVVVYLVKQEDGKLLELHLRQIERHTNVPYTIYGGANRLLPQFRRILEEHPKVKICECPDTDLRAAKEHAFYLDILVQAAIEDGASDVVTLDVDSFPVCSGWIHELAARISGNGVAAAILRRENGDQMLPHPACLFFHRDFYLRYKPSFCPPDDLVASPQFRRFVEQYEQPLDTGIGYAFCIHEAGLSWHPLLRSNKRQDHYLIGGIYGDLIFHLAAGSRPHVPGSFRGDRLRRRLSASRVNRTVRDLSKHLPEWAKALLVRSLPHRFEYLRRTENANLEAFEQVRARLLDDPDGYISYLRTGDPEASAAGSQRRSDVCGREGRRETDLPETFSCVRANRFMGDTPGAQAPAVAAVKPIVSICIPTYNGGRWIREAIRSALAQPYEPFEVLVVDDASTDNTVAQVRSFADDRVRVKVNSQNLGLARNWNRCVQLARGELIKFLFQDDLLHPNCLEKMVPLFQQSKRVGMVFAPREVILENPDDRHAIKFKKKNGILHRRFQDLRRLNRGMDLFDQWLRAGFHANWVGEPTAVMVRRECFERLGGFNTRMCQRVDYEMWIRILYFYDVGFVSEPLAAFRFHDRSTSLANKAHDRQWLDALWLLEGLLNHSQIRSGRPQIKKLRWFETVDAVRKMRVLKRLVKRKPLYLWNKARALREYLMYRWLWPRYNAPSLHSESG